ncbi:sugar transferase (PEP-CTERM/EpsH1 system associated) [Duganella sp. 1411]|uniref:TIGR03087 family PEP-CTERM/XrtA system glycosyltransferase n=1 Tax=Duganella sp. 1411 TaxID=2806572 RepID=UPI001AE9A688|nr:sugar transferase (PEP-CTERM/EpsH1 system associated) [Duganella sp. 1411]
MEKLLLLVHRIPYPPNKGDKIRSYHLLRHLCARYQVYLGAFVDDADDWRHVPRLQAMCAGSHFAALHPLRARLRSLPALAGGRALSCDYYRDAGLRRWVDDTVRREGISRIVCYSSPMAQYADAHPSARRVMDFVDVDSDKWRQYAAGKRWPMRQVYQREARLLLDYERQVARAWDASLFVSAPEAQLFRTLAPESAARIGHYSNGVDTSYFSPAHQLPSPYPPGARVLAFTGAMDYWPNVDAVSWFAREVLPAIRAAAPDVVFCIVGSRPAPAVQRLAELPGVLVTGTVPDVRAYLAHAALCVAPMRIARGIQNKVLEAMAMARPVLVSPQALEGIDAVPGRELLLADDATTLARAALAYLGAPDPAIGPAARAKVEKMYGWESNLASVSDLLEQRRAQPWPRSA